MSPVERLVALASSGERAVLDAGLEGEGAGGKLLVDERGETWGTARPAGDALTGLLPPR
ncbi:MAG TPA: hypothetical protein VEY87_04415 [Gaiellaceae bacterium]|jgi:hypothetical protein|nr:hypothetical protein [Gaiellaceae bacterium]